MRLVFNVFLGESFLHVHFSVSLSLSLSLFPSLLLFCTERTGESCPRDSYSIINVRLSGHLLLRSGDMAKKNNTRVGPEEKGASEFRAEGKKMRAIRRRQGLICSA